MFFDAPPQANHRLVIGGRGCDFSCLAAGSKSVCAISDHTTADSAGTQPTSQDAAANPAHQCDALGRTES